MGVAELIQAFDPIGDWRFYAVAIPGVVLLGISKSGFGSGFGSLVVPMLALVITVPQAAALLMPVLLVMDLLGMAALRRDLNVRLLRFLIPCALAGVAVGAAVFRFLDVRWISAILGVVILLFLLQRRLQPPRADAPAPPRWLGAVLTVVSGFTSFVAHAGGPPLSAYMLKLRLPPPVYAATLAFLFFFVNLAKWVPYAWLGLLDVRAMSTAMVLLPLAPVGVWLGVRIARRISPTRFYQLVQLGMLLTACKLISDAALG